ncbi:hypothetical protein B0T26DRAFT_492159 [Lasiosphaeria miniovina]|uniref:Uncharacterized protein n=1 Tax=Lasiosphaeria miniovina TaxID=1954250 RepID=A0AA39ZTE0_9PEZI|nr:uncharacterized protein B0T26DRAFT_492159 [Lasiosphaeria miniovina]KAK0703200.1 hypothetical protein B0T26DRAFT_492159 [Lasiosphaeria miniovina]
MRARRHRDKPQQTHAQLLVQQPGRPRNKSSSPPNSRSRTANSPTASPRNTTARATRRQTLRPQPAALATIAPTSHHAQQPAKRRQTPRPQHNSPPDASTTAREPRAPSQQPAFFSGVPHLT